MRFEGMIFSKNKWLDLQLLFVYGISSLLICLLFPLLPEAEATFIPYIRSSDLSTGFLNFTLLFASQFISYKLLEYNLCDAKEKQLRWIAIPFGLIFCFLILFIVQLSFSILFV